MPRPKVPTGLASGPRADRLVGVALGLVVGFAVTTALLLTSVRLGIDAPPYTTFVSLFLVQRWTRQRVMEALVRADLEIAMRGDASA